MNKNNVELFNIWRWVILECKGSKYLNILIWVYDSL